MNFLLNDEKCAVVLGTKRGIPSSHTAEKSLELSVKLQGLVQENDTLLENLDTVTIRPYMELTRMKSFYNDAIEKVSYEKTDTAEAAHEMYISINEYLEKIRK